MNIRHIYTTWFLFRILFFSFWIACLFCLHVIVIAAATVVVKFLLFCKKLFDFIHDTALHPCLCVYVHCYRTESVLLVQLLMSLAWRILHTSVPRQIWKEVILTISGYWYALNSDQQTSASSKPVVCNVWPSVGCYMPCDLKKIAEIW